MSLWDDVPYELQSPSFRNAANQTETGGSGWNPTLNTNFATDILSAFQNTARPSGEVNTVNANGQTGFVNSLKDVGVSLLSHLGARDSADASMQQAAMRRSGGMNPSNLLIIAGLGVGAYYLLNR